MMVYKFVLFTHSVRMMADSSNVITKWNEICQKHESLTTFVWTIRQQQ